MTRLSQARVEVPEAQKTAKGRAIINLLMLDEGEKVTTIIASKVYTRKNSDREIHLYV